MEGFLGFITGNSPEAIDLRRRVVFKIVPMSNPDGVIIGNYRASLSGNDLNRRFLTPNAKLHPTVFNIKKLLREINNQS
jgi:murein tripeptide amidase MpaA